MVALILLLIAIWVLLGIIGTLAHGLIWLTVAAAVLFVATVVFGGSRIGRHKIQR